MAEHARPEDTSRRVARMERVAGVMDASFALPGTGIRFGLDSLVGLIPGIGDTATAAVSGWIVYEAWKLGLPRHKLLHMGANIGIDAVIGAIPLIGDLFDVGWKANLRNTRMVKEHFGNGPKTAEKSGKTEKLPA